MKKLFIKYNPYKLETEFTVDGKKLAQNSQIGERIFFGTRLQEWIEDLPKLLIKEYNDNDFDIVFHGTLLDFEDLTEVFTKAIESGTLTAKLDRIPAKETSDKEVLIDEVFEDIQKGPFDELRDETIIHAFQQAKSSDFEVCVVATMSAGKSTLINAMLGTKLMPSKQNACTAKITRIKDVDESNTWRAEVYDKDQCLLETQEKLTYATMERLNDDENISMIKVAGNIPFVTSEDVSLVLIDTPGPNNANNLEHKKVQSEFLNKSSKSLILYIMEGTFGSDDDNTLLQRVADSMKVGGKQSKDRFIFVVNKMDQWEEEDDDITQILDRVRAYLKVHEITNPNLFPAAALPALNIRRMQSGAEISANIKKSIEYKTDLLNQNEPLHLENYAPLPKNVRDKIEKKLNDAKNNDDVNTEALIHTGILSVEAAIRQYVQKYAKTAKIKNIVDTFSKKLDEVGCFEKTKQELAKNREDGERIAQQFKTIRKKIDDVKTAQQFKNAVEGAVNKVKYNTRDVIDNVLENYQKIISIKIDALRNKDVNTDDVKYEINYLENYAKELEPKFQAELDTLIQAILVKTSEKLLEEYKNKLVSLTSEIDPNALYGVSIEPLKLMGGQISMIDNLSIEKLIHSKVIEDGEEWIENTEKTWLKPWTWFQEDGYYQKKYKSVEYVHANELAQEFFTPIEVNLGENGDEAHKYAIQQSQRIAEYFNKEFERLDDILKQKLLELENYAIDKTKAEERIKETEERLKWLEEIKDRVTSILEI